MTDHTDLINKLRDTASKGVSVWGDLQMEAADALEAAQAEIERLTTDRRVLQADGKHPAPCAKFCEATAFTIELRRAHAEIEKLREVWLEDGVRASEDRGDLLKERDQAQAEIEAQQHRIQALWMERDVVRVERDKALARIAKLEPKRNVSPPSEELVLHKMRYHFWEADDDEPADFELFDAGVECDTCIDVALVRQDRLDELIAANALIDKLTARLAEIEASNAELERLCDATYVAQGADAYNHACECMEVFQEKRRAAGKEVGTTHSLCDGMEWLYSRLDELEAGALQSAQAEIDAVRKANVDCVNHFDALRLDY